MKKTTLAEKFWNRVNKDGPISLYNPSLGPCWIWNGSHNSNGYSRLVLNRGKSSKLAHRVSYQLNIGKIPPGLDLDHLCRVRGCVNPKHLEPVTRQVNLLRGQTIPAMNFAKTHCPKGHEYSPENTYTDKENCRHCRMCKNETWMRMWYRRKAKCRQ